MQKRLTLSLFFTVFSCLALFAQDTLVVTSLNFKSSSKRDTMVYFPTEDHNNFEKILMLYTMRCKNALVSTSTNRNLGCGEWDYSCNTSLIDSTKTDSLKTIAPNYIFSGYAENYFPYTTKPTYSYTSFTQKDAVVTSTSGEKIVQIGSGTQKLNTPFASNTKTAKAYYLVRSTEIDAALNKKLEGIEIELDAAMATANFLKIKLKETTQNELAAASLETDGFQEVYFKTTDIGTKGFKRFVFYKPFTWTGTSNIIIELSYNNQSPLANANLVGDATTFNAAAYTSEDDGFVQFNGANNLTLPADKMNSISNEITIGFWSYGNVDALPTNTIILNAVDGNNIRQLNVHLPWSNSNVFWDCGGDAAGYDRINKLANDADFKGKWNYWTFTKNVTAKTMKIYLNGVLWTSGTAKAKPINIKKFRLGMDFDGNNPYIGYLDDFAVWNKELDEATIKQNMYQKMTDSNPNYANLVCFYDFNENNTSLETADISSNKSVATYSSLPARKVFQGRERFKQFSFASERPNFKFFNGTYQKAITNTVVLDSIQNSPYQIRPFYVENNNLKESKSLYYWLAGDYNILDEAGAIIGTKTVAEENILDIEDLTYFRRFPMKYEIMSFVTPYGIGLDLGKNGKTWTFDASDLGPILHGAKRMKVEYGGQNQEELDIKFLFIKGKPARDVQSIRQIWPVSATPYSTILSNNAFEPRDIEVPAQTKAAKIRTAITGHGQEGEFIAQNHFININGGAKELEWYVWKECGKNPVYPQGGTWIYDRAGWCPGAPTDVKELDITSTINNSKKFSVDYGVTTAQGDSRYIVNSQLVTYGAANFKNDAAVNRIIRPSLDIENGRYNPVCMNPEIEIRNTGENALTSLDITYGIKGATTSTYQWKGNLAFLGTARVILPSFGVEKWAQNDAFVVNISNPNGKTDEYAKNNTMETKFAQAKKWNSSIVIQMKTNSFPNETFWELTDENGKVLRSRKNGLKATTTYLDTINNLNGCYQWKITDTDGDGINFWANSDGAGNIGIRNLGSTLTTLQPDFGSEINYQFFAGNVTATEELSYTPEVLVYPNPTQGMFTVQLEGVKEAFELNVIDLQGKNVYTQHLPLSSDLHREVQIDLHSAAAGLYFVQIKGAKSILTERVVKM